MTTARRRRRPGWALAALLWPLVAAAAPAGEIDWLEGADGYRRGVEAAAAADRPLLVYFYTDWCPYCRQLNRELLTTDRVQAAVASMVAVRINPESGPEESALAARFGIRGYPALFVDDGSGPRPIRRTIASGNRQRLMTPDEFAATLASATR